MSDGKDMEQPLVFGLDIGTRNVVGTVGYKTENEFVVVAQYMLCLLYTSPSPRDMRRSRMPSSA